MVVMPRKPEIRIPITADFSASPPRIISVAGLDVAATVHYFSDTAEVISIEEVIRAAKLLALSKEPVAHDATRRTPLLTKLRVALQHPVVALREAICGLGLTHTTAQPIVTKHASVGRVAIDGHQSVGRVPDVADRGPGRRVGHRDEIPVEVVGQCLRGTIAEDHRVVLGHGVPLVIRHGHPHCICFDARSVNSQ